MASPTWTAAALRSEAAPHAGLWWRCVEAQHIVSTRALVDSLDDQLLLEDILEDTKPRVPVECEGLHYLYMTPFRYGPYPVGSRFRRAGLTPGVYYAAQRVETALAETAFHTLLFFAESPGTPFPARAIAYTAFDVRVKTDAAIDLRTGGFMEHVAVWAHPTDYGPTQALEETAREADVDAILYASVRDPGGGANIALLTCRAFAAKAPRRQQGWKLHFGASGVDAFAGLGGRRFNMPPEAFAYDPRIPAGLWAR